MLVTLLTVKVFEGKPLTNCVLILLKYLWCNDGALKPVLAEPRSDKPSTNLKRPDIFPGEASRFESTLIHSDGVERRVLVISSGWLTLAKGKKRSAIVSIVDVSENTELKRINDEQGHAAQDDNGDARPA